MSEYTPGCWQAAQRIRRECKTGHSAQHWAAIISEETGDADLLAALIDLRLAATAHGVAHDNPANVKAPAPPSPKHTGRAET